MSPSVGSVSDCTAIVLMFSFIPTLDGVVASFYAFSAFCTVASHLFRCSALIPDAPPER